MAAIVLLALLASQLTAMILYWQLLPRWQRELRPEVAVSDIALTTHLLEAAPPAERHSYIESLGAAHLKVQWDPSAGGIPDGGAGPQYRALRAQIAEAVGKPLEAVAVRASATGSTEKIVRVALRDGTTLRFAAAIGAPYRLGVVEQAAVCVFFFLVLGSLWIWVSWMIRALTRFARAAEGVGRNIRAPALDLQGPAELRRAIGAFNEMQLRLQRMIDDRTRMLGAISHDLRTPLTRLKLRVETARSAELAQLLAEIESMEAMLQSAFAFIRGVDEGERADTVDFGMLVQTVCDGIADLGGLVSYQGVERLRVSCRPNAMMRALTNVVNNAVKYGREARVSLHVAAAGGIVLLIDDSGPGIPDADKEIVFEPFYRRPQTLQLHDSGLGLGLSIARSIVLAHGGTIELQDLEPHGLRALIVLPRDGSSGADLAPMSAAV
jgi:signal transduction histidine kinase